MRAFSFLCLVIVLYSCKSQKTSSIHPLLQKITVSDSLYGMRDSFFRPITISSAGQNGDSLLITVNICHCYTGSFTLVQSSVILKSSPVKLKMALRQDAESPCECEETTPRKLAFNLKDILETHLQADLMLYGYSRPIRVIK